MAESDRDCTTGGNGSELVTGLLADVPGFISVGRTDKWVTLGALASLKRGLCQKTIIGGENILVVEEYYFSGFSPSLGS